MAYLLHGPASDRPVEPSERRKAGKYGRDSATAVTPLPWPCSWRIAFSSRMEDMVRAVPEHSGQIKESALSRAPQKSKKCREGEEDQSYRHGCDRGPAVAHLPVLPQIRLKRSAWMSPECTPARKRACSTACIIGGGPQIMYSYPSSGGGACRRKRSSVTKPRSPRHPSGG